MLNFFPVNYNILPQRHHLSAAADLRPLLDQERRLERVERRRPGRQHGRPVQPQFVRQAFLLAALLLLLQRRANEQGPEPHPAVGMLQEEVIRVREADKRMMIFKSFCFSGLVIPAYTSVNVKRAN